MGLRIAKFNKDVMVVRRGGLQIHDGFCIELETTYAAPDTYIRYCSDARYNSFETACNFVYFCMQMHLPLRVSSFASVCKCIHDHL